MHINFIVEMKWIFAFLQNTKSTKIGHSLETKVYPTKKILFLPFFANRALEARLVLKPFFSGCGRQLEGRTGVIGSRGHVGGPAELHQKVGVKLGGNGPAVVVVRLMLLLKLLRERTRDLLWVDRSSTFAEVNTGCWDDHCWSRDKKQVTGRFTSWGGSMIH